MPQDYISSSMCLWWTAVKGLFFLFPGLLFLLTAIDICHCSQDCCALAWDSSGRNAALHCLVPAHQIQYLGTNLPSSSFHFQHPSSAHDPEVYCVLPVLELLPWSCGVCWGVHDGPWGFHSSCGSAAASVVPVASTPGQVTTFCRRGKWALSGFSVFLSQVLVPSCFERPALTCLPSGSEGGFFPLPADACQTEAFSAQPFPRAFSGWLPVCLWLLRNVLGDAMSLREIAVMWGSKRLSIPVSWGISLLSQSMCLLSQPWGE